MGIRRGVVEAVLVVLGGALGESGAFAQPAAAGSDAVRLLEHGDLAKARPALQARAGEALLLLATAQEAKDRKATAAAALALLPESERGLRAWARGLDLLDGKPAEAAQAFREAAAARPSDPHLRKLLGDAVAAAGDPSAAIDAYDAAVRLQPDYAAALLAEGSAARKLGDFTRAFNAYNHAAAEDGKPVDAWIGRAGSRLYLGDKDGALADLALVASKAEPGPERYRALLAILSAHAYLHDLPTGVDRAEQAVSMWQELARPDMAAAACNAAGRVLLESGRVDDGEKWYERGWQIVDGSSLDAEAKKIWKVRQLHGLSRVAAKQRDLKKAEDLAAEAKTVMDTDPKNAEHYAWIYPYLTGYLKIEERKYADAIADLKQSDTERAFVRLLVAQAYDKSRDKANARDWYQKALLAADGLDPESALARPIAAAWLAKNR